jgi:hypothetical protein
VEGQGIIEESAVRVVGELVVVKVASPCWKKRMVVGMGMNRNDDHDSPFFFLLFHSSHYIVAVCNCAPGLVQVVERN